MRDQRLVALHRGGLLTKDNHQKLMNWARKCSQHVLYLTDNSLDERLIHALQVAEDWEKEKVKTGVAMKASLGAHAAARESSNPVSTAVARSIGQGVATAHMADHSLGAALYALKAVKLAGQSTAKERTWQISQLRIRQLSPELTKLMLALLMQKEKSMKITCETVRQ